MTLLKKSVTNIIILLFSGAIIFNIIEGLCLIFLAANTGDFVNVVTGESNLSLKNLLFIGLLYSLLLMVSIYIQF